jgi:hypothetical protein
MRTRLTIPLVCIAAIALGAPGCGSGNDSENRAQDQAAAIAGDLDGVLSDAGDQLAKLARLPAVKSGSPNRCSAAMTSAARLGNDSGEFTALGAATTEGDLNCLSIPITTPITVSDRAYFLRALGTGGLGVGDYQISRATGLQALGLGYPIDRSASGQRYVAVVTSVDLRWLAKRISDERDPDAVDVLVTDDHGTVLVRTSDVKTAAGENLGSDPLVQAMLSEGDGTGEFAGDAGNLAYGYTTVPASGDELHVAVGVRP